MKLKKNYKIIISESAKTDIRQAAQWYNNQQKGLGKQFIHAIKDCVKTIQLQPEGFQIRYKNVRVGIPNKFPYLVIYLIDKGINTISIIAVFHSSQNPGKWKNIL